LHIAIWTIGITFVLDILVLHFELKVIPHYISVIRSAILVFCLSWVMIRWIKVTRLAVTEKSLVFGLDRGTIHAFAKISIFVISILTCVILLQIFGLNVMPLLAFGGIGAAALGFAGKDVIANFFGGLMLHINRSFITGENILIPNQNNLEGKVEEIGWYTTSIRDMEKRLVFLPNALFSSMLIINLSRMTHRRILERLKIRSEDFPHLSVIISKIQDLLKRHKKIDSQFPMHVVFAGFGEYSLDLLIEVYTFETRYDDFLLLKQELLIHFEQILQSCGAELSVPSTYVHLVK
jgi:MscS family membrane protein